MKKQVNNKYVEKYKTTAKHEGTYPFHSGNVVTDKIPPYSSSGLVKFKRILPPLKDPLDIDTTILAQVLKEVYPNYDFAELKLEAGLCTVGKVRFRYNGLKSLLKNLREEKYLSFSIDSVYNQYNLKYHENKNDC